MSSFSDPDHPMVTTEFIVLTNEIKRVCEIAIDAVYMRRTGVVFYGASRLGKTQCAKTLEKKLARFMPRSYVLKVSVVNREGMKNTNIISQLAVILNVMITLRETRLSIFNKVASEIERHVKEKNCNQFTLLLDELQRIKSPDLYQLADLYNVLDNNHVKMTVVSFAMPDVLLVRADFARQEQRQIIARFMSDLIEFKGCTSLDDMKLILHAMDFKSEYPAGSNLSYTKGILPIAFSNGFRLETYASVIWQVLNESAHGAYKKNLPMEHILISIRYLYRICLEKEGVEFRLTIDDVRHAVFMSKISPFTMENGK